MNVHLGGPTAMSGLEVWPERSRPDRCCLRSGLRGHGSDEVHGPAAGAGHSIPVQVRGISMRFAEYSFGSVRIDGVTYDHDLIIDRGQIRKRRRPHPRSSGALTGTLRCRPPKTSPGAAVGW
jgi:hypothetical protein